jgi:hypothetical protein
MKVRFVRGFDAYVGNVTDSRKHRVADAHESVLTVGYTGAAIPYRAL